MIGYWFHWNNRLCLLRLLPKIVQNHAETVKPLTQWLSLLDKPNHEQAISRIPGSIEVCEHPKAWLSLSIDKGNFSKIAPALMQW